MRLTPRVAALLLTGALASALAQSVYRIPVQVSDSLEPLVIAATADSTPQLFASVALHGSESTLRPMRYVQARWLMTLAEATGLSYNAAFRGFHALLVLVLLFLFTAIAAIQVRTWADVAALGVALMVLIGLHSFAGMLREAYPVNHFAEIALASLSVFALAQRPHRTSHDVALVLLLAWCLLLVESGVLVWVVAVTCAAVRCPGISRRTVVAATLVLAVYAGTRYLIGIKSPDIGSHASGYGARLYSAEALRTRFGAAPAPFMAYNVAGGLLSLLFSEPRAGVYQAVAAASTGRVAPVFVINAISSILTTWAIFWFAVRGARGRHDEWTNDRRTLIVAAAVAVASALMCAAYIKDEILSTAGVFYALAAFAAVRMALNEATRPTPALRALALGALLVVATPFWTFRAAGIHFTLRLAAFGARNEWSSVPTSDPTVRSNSTRALEVARRLKQEAIDRPVAIPQSLPAWGKSYWVE